MCVCLLKKAFSYRHSCCGWLYGVMNSPSKIVDQNLKPMVHVPTVVASNLAVHVHVCIVCTMDYATMSHCSLKLWL